MLFNISMIVACTQNQVIGREGDLPWKLKDDMRFFVKATLGKKVLMGRKTFESIIKAIGKPLPNRENWVMTRDPVFAKHLISKFESVRAFHDLQEVLSVLQNQELMIAGGAEIYRQFLPFAHKIYLTKVDVTLEGDAFFPELNSDDWEVISMQEYSQNPENQYGFKIMELQRKK
jgi:dihydrofolate reductase